MSLAPPTRSVTVRVPAKVNLDLRVGAVRDDGFHDLATIFMAVGLYDEVTVTPSTTWSVQTTGPYAALVPDTTDNLALKAARLLDRRLRYRRGPVHIRIDKAIPVAGGMAGGSADAAAALVACDALWGMRAERDHLDTIGAAIGSDVPFALHGGIAMGSGRGERITPVLARGTYHWVFALSPEGLSTPAVYAECDRLRGDAPVPTPEASPALMSALRSGDALALGAALHNDLQEAALSLRPDLGEVLSAGLEYGALGGIVSGSGPTIAFLTGSAEHALDLCVALTASGVASEVTRARGPVLGAHLIAGATRE